MSTKNTLYDPVLVLSKAWVPYKIHHAIDSFSKLIGDKAKVIITHDLSMRPVNFEEWLKISEYEFGMNNAAHRWVNAGRCNIIVPEVIINGDESVHTKAPRRTKWSRKKIFTRDRYRCQYCDKELHEGECTLDHVFPESRGGKDTWENLTTACFPCNGKKGNRTPEEASMHLRKKPKMPNHSITMPDSKFSPKPAWANFINLDLFGEQS